VLLPWLLVLIIGALVLFLLLPVPIRFRYHHRQGAGDLAIEADLLFGLITLAWAGARRGLQLTLFHPCLTIPIPFPGSFKSPAGKEGGQGERPKYEQLVSLLRDGRRFLPQVLSYSRRLLRMSRLEIESLEMELGTGDAAETGILTGLLWSSLGLLRHLFPAGEGNYKIIPHFNRAVLKIRVSGILQVRPGHIITVMLQLLVKMLWEKYGKGVDLGGRTSNSGFNENCHGEY